MLSKLRVRLVIWTVALEAVLLLIFGALLIFTVQETQNQQIDEALRLSASQLNAVVDIQAGRYVIQDADKAALSAQGVVAWVLTPEGDIVATVGSIGAAPPPTLLPTPAQMINAPLPNGEPGRYLVDLSERRHAQFRHAGAGAVVAEKPGTPARDFAELGRGDSGCAARCQAQADYSLPTAPFRRSRRSRKRHARSQPMTSASA